MISSQVSMARFDKTFERPQRAIDKTIDLVLDDPASRITDVGGKAGTKRFGRMVTEALAKG